MTSRPEERTADFPSTRWSRILARPGGRDLEALARSYWRPIRAYLGACLRVGDEAASDLAQEAFAWMLATRLFDHADPARGRFRGLLKTALKRFAIEQLRKQAADKRGGGRTHEPIDAAWEPADPRSQTPDQILDAAWRRELLQRAQEELQSELQAGGRGTCYAVFRDYFLDERPGTGGADDVDYQGLATRYGITRTDVSNWLAHAKRRYREILRGLVLDTVANEEDLQEELRWLFGTGSRPEPP